jgi:hypothetical protein
MRKIESRFTEVRVEIVTTTFVAAGRPEGIHDLTRFLEALNNPVITHQIEFRSPSVRPLYRASAQLQLEAALLVRRDDVIFANFEGPNFARAGVRPTTKTMPVLLMAPPFQINATIEIAVSADPTQALRSATQGFFVVRNAMVFDADGHPLGEGDQVIVNGAAVQMTCATQQHIEEQTAAAPPAVRAIEIEDKDETERGLIRAA